MNKRKTIYFLLAFAQFLLCVPPAWAQPAALPALWLHTDQQVYITGEDIWVDGILPAVDERPKFAKIRLLNRSGQVVSEMLVDLQEGHFAGFLSPPAILPSDYYFVDCSVKGMDIMVRLQPVMIIHPQVPPSVVCNSGGKPVDPFPGESGTMHVQTDKKEYASRAPVALHLTSTADAGPFAIYVRRRDKLSIFTDSLSTLYQLFRKHASREDVEKEGHHISVRVSDLASGQPKSGLKLMAALSGQPAKLSVSTTDAAGIAHFILPMLWGECNLVFTAVEQGAQGYRYTILHQPIPDEPIDFPCLQLREEFREDIEARVFNVRMTKKYYGDQLTEYRRTEEDTTDFYGKPDRRYLLDDYTRFPNMEEILGEYVPEIRVRNPGSDAAWLQVLNLPYKKYFASQGIILLDGIPVRNTKSLLSMDPLLLQSIDVVSRAYYIGEQLFDGIVQYKSYKKDLAGFSLGADYFIQPFMGVQPHASPVFFQKDHQEATRPDLRNLMWRDIHLAPNVKTPQTFQFYTGDAPGTYEVIVLSAMQSGKPKKNVALFTVQ